MCTFMVTTREMTKFGIAWQFKEGYGLKYLSNCITVWLVSKQVLHDNNDNGNSLTIYLVMTHGQKLLC